MVRLINVPYYREKLKEMQKLLKKRGLEEFTFSDIKDILSKKEFNKFVSRGIISPKKMVNSNGVLSKVKKCNKTIYRLKISIEEVNGKEKIKSNGDLLVFAKDFIGRYEKSKKDGRKKIR